MWKKIILTTCLFLTFSLSCNPCNKNNIISNLSVSTSLANSTDTLPAIDLLLLSRCKEIYDWLCSWQDNNTGLMASHEDNKASTYNNAIASMVFILHGDANRAKKIFNFFNERMNDTEFFIDGKEAGFYQSRNIATGIPFVSDRWYGDNAFLLMAINYYKKKQDYQLMMIWQIILQVGLFLFKMLMDRYKKVTQRGIWMFTQH